MYTIILCALIIYILVVIIEIREYKFCVDPFLQNLPAFIPGILIGLIIALVLPERRVTDKYSLNLVSLQDHNTISGSFFLGSGQINGRMRYVLYYETDSNTYKMFQVDYDDALIKYTDGQPKMNVSYTHSCQCLWNKFSISITPDEYSYIFEIPKGSIKNNFTLDAQ